MSGRCRPERPAQRITLQIDSSLQQTPLVAMAIRGLCGLTELPVEAVNRIELGVVEVVNNAIEHAYAGRAGQPVEVEVVLTTHQHMEIIVRDCGESMDSALVEGGAMTVPDPDDPGTWLSSGRGLAIVRQLIDEIWYETVDGQNAFHLLCHLPS